MNRSVLVLIVTALAACGGTRASGKTTSGDSAANGDLEVVKHVVTHFGTEAVRDQLKIWLSLTDETGAVNSYPLEEIHAAECSAEEGGEMKALGTLRCAARDNDKVQKVANYIAVARQGEIILLRQKIDDATGDWGEYVELKRLTIPAGSGVSFRR
jgi:hypothetical protein